MSSSSPYPEPKTYKSTATSSDPNFPKITLHWLEVSRSHRILWLLEELSIPYELKLWKRHPTEKRADPGLKEVHPLGKSPVVTIDPVNGNGKQIVLIESSNIVEYLCEYYGTWLIPSRYEGGANGDEGAQRDKVGLDREEWLRYRTFMHYAEGSIMPLMVTSLLVNMIRTSPVPFFIRPVTNGVANKLTDGYLKPNFKTHYEWLESELQTSPNGGQYLCGKELTAADVMMSFPLEAGESRAGMTKEQCPKLWAYLDLLHEREAYKRSVQKIIEIEGDFKTNL